MPRIKHPRQPAVMVGKTARYKENKIVRYVLERAKLGEKTDLNMIMILPFSNGDRRQFWQLLGYSLSGYADLSFAERDCPTTIREARRSK